MTRDPLRPGSRPWPTVVLELLTCAAAGYGGVGLAWHNVVRMPDSWLQHGPFTSWQVPGLLLPLVVAVPMGLAAALELRRSPWAAVASVGAGAALVGWGPGGWVSMKGGAIAVRPARRGWRRVRAEQPPARRPWWARLLSATTLQALVRG